MTGYQALRESSAWLDLSARGRIRAMGEDRVRLLHAMCTNHIQQLRTGEGCYAFFLNPQGRILADALVLALPDALLIDTEPETRQSLYAHLDKYIIADDVTLEDTTAETVAIGIEGPAAADVMARLGAPQPAAPCSHQGWDDRLVIRSSVTGQPGFSIVAPAAHRETLIREIEAAGAIRASDQDARVVRLELGHPRYGEDITDRDLPTKRKCLGRCTSTRAVTSARRLWSASAPVAACTASWCRSKSRAPTRPKPAPSSRRIGRQWARSPHPPGRPRAEDRCARLPQARRDFAR